MESCTFVQVKKFPLITFYLIAWMLGPAAAVAQSASSGASFQKNAFTFNLGQYLVNEINLGYEHLFNEKKSIEFNVGLIYRNELLRKQSEEWTNSQYFYERGFGLKVSHRIYRKGADKASKRNYYSFGINYQHLFFNSEWFETDHQPTIVIKDIDNKDSLTTQGTEEIYQRRTRNRIGIHFISGNIFPLNNNFAFEIFYGIGIRGIFSNRYDIAVANSGFGRTWIYESGNRDEKFYIRPTIHAGVKLRLGW